MTIIYGIDTDKPITPSMVLEAIKVCFYSAHCFDTGLGTDEKSNKSYCLEIVKKAFEESQADINNPTKADILAVINKLAAFSKSFRDPTIVEQHFSEIMKLVNKIPE